MDLQHKGDGRVAFVLGPVERWVVGVVAGAVLAAGYWFVSSLTQRLDKQNDTLQAVVTQQAVTNGQIQTLTAQLADVPRLTRDMAELKVRVDQHDQDIRELKQLRRVR